MVIFNMIYLSKSKNVEINVFQYSLKNKKKRKEKTAILEP